MAKLDWNKAKTGSRGRYRPPVAPADALGRGTRREFQRFAMRAHPNSTVGRLILEQQSEEYQELMAQNKSFEKELKEMGLAVFKKGNNHYKVYTPEGVWVMDYSGTPGDRNWRKAATRRLTHKLGEIYGEGSG